MTTPTGAYLDVATLHKLWTTTLPRTSCDKSFWTSFEQLCGAVLDETCALRSGEFFSVAHTGRVAQDDVHVLNRDVVRACNELRSLYTTLTLLNPCAVAALLQVPVSVVVDQLLLAVEARWVTLRFVVCCSSCACDMLHRDAVSAFAFAGTYHHAPNVFRCPICTDRTELTELQNVCVFFQLDKLHPSFQRLHHRQYITELAEQRRLEAFFCPAGAGYAVTLHLPRGRYLLSAPFMEAFVELEVEVDASAMGERDAYLQRIVDLKLYTVAERLKRAQQQQQQQQQQQMMNSSSSGGGPMSGVVGAAMGAMRYRSMSRRQTVLETMSTSTANRSGNVDGATTTTAVAAASSIAYRFGSFATDSAPTSNGGAVGGATTTTTVTAAAAAAAVAAGGGMLLPSIPVLSLRHGKVMLRVYNDTPHSGFLDVFVALDVRTEFTALDYPQLMTVPHFLHCVPRGLRSPFLPRCMARAPSVTPTTGVYVRQYFDLPASECDKAAVMSVLREVHRYSLEDHQGLLLGVSHGGTSFESSFLTLAAALASCICFFQRVLVRLGARVALCLRCSATEGPLAIAAYEGQYNDAENMRSSYPDVQFVGPVVYASVHPPIVPPYLTAYEEEPPRPVEVFVGSSSSNNSIIGYNNNNNSHAGAAAAAAAAALAAGGGGFVRTTVYHKRASVTPRRMSLDRYGISGGAICNGVLLASNAVGGMAGRGSVTGPSSPIPYNNNSSSSSGGGSGNRAMHGSVFGAAAAAAGVPDFAPYGRPRMTSSYNNGSGNKDNTSIGSSGSKEKTKSKRHGQYGGNTYNNDDDDDSDASTDSETAAAAAAVAFMPGPSMVRFELRSVRRDDEGVADVSRGSVCLSDDYRNGHREEVLPHLLEFLCDRFDGTVITAEAHALVVQMPLPVLLAAVSMSTTLARSSYARETAGPF